MHQTVGTGGVGTFDELWEGVAEVSLGFKDVPIVCVNVNGYYDSFQQMLERAFADKLIYRPPNDLLGMESTARVSLCVCVFLCGCFLLRYVRTSSLPPIAARSFPASPRVYLSLMRTCIQHAHAFTLSRHGCRRVGMRAKHDLHASTLCTLLVTRTSSDFYALLLRMRICTCDVHAHPHTAAFMCEQGQRWIGQKRRKSNAKGNRN